MWLGVDIGGANLKIADGRGFSASRFFPLWQQPNRLGATLAEMFERATTARRLAVTMTGELADCFETKSDGVRAILDGLVRAADGRDTWVYLTTGTMVRPVAAGENPLLAAASNWHALARFTGRYASEGAALLIDVGSTTTDLIPLDGGRPVARGRTDPQRLLHGELVYTGVRRSPVCALVSSLPWRGGRCPTAQEVFATTWDAYVTLGELPEQPDARHTADGRPATKTAARDRLARSICADRDMFDGADALRAAEVIAGAQAAKVAIAVKQVVRRMSGVPRTVVVSGEGEFLARRMAERLCPKAKIVSLNDLLGRTVSRCAAAHALAVLAREEIQ